MRSDGKVSHELIGQICRGTHSGNLTDRTLDGLALALDLPRSALLRAMNREQYSSKPFEAPDRWRRLSHAQRQVVLKVGDMMLQSYEQGRQDEAEQSDAAAEVLELPRVARKRPDPRRRT